MAVFTFGAVGFSFDDIEIGILIQATISVATPTIFSVTLDGETTSFIGSGFTYNSLGNPTGGTVTRITDAYQGQNIFDLTGLNVSATDLLTYAVTGDNLGARQALLAGADIITGSAQADLIRGYAGDDLINSGSGNDGIDGGGGNDTVNAGGGNDTIVEISGQNYLRGDEGNDSIGGGTGFDDINGNMGNDSASGGVGDDWVVGGKDNDTLSGDAGGDLVYGNLGADICDGGDGNDIVRGGQDDDVVRGGGGDDYVSGDKGADTISGGTGADLFHTFGDAGVDRVLDFSRAEGDRVLLDPGTVYTVAQVGADIVISMTGGGQMILIDVAQSSLTGDWIFGN